MGRPPHVLIVTPWFPSPYAPLSGSFLAEFARASAPLWQTDVIHVLSVSPRRVFWLLRHLRLHVAQQDGYTAYRQAILSVERLSPGLAGFLNIRAAKKAYRKMAASGGKPDIIHGHVSFPGGFAACKLAERERLSAVVTEHASQFECFAAHMRRATLYALEHAARLTAVGGALRETVAAYARRPCELIPNGIDLSRFTLRRQRVDDKFVMISVTGMNKIKRLELIVEALRRNIRRGHVDMRLILVGDGGERAALERQVREAELEEYVIFAGILTGQALRGALSGCDCMVIASERETFCVSGVEAMAAGLPVLSTMCGGPQDYITEDTGMLVPVNDPDALAGGMAAMKDRLPGFDPAAIRRHVEQRYGADAVMRWWRALYEAVLAEPAPKM